MRMLLWAGWWGQEVLQSLSLILKSLVIMRVLQILTSVSQPFCWCSFHCCHKMYYLEQPITDYLLNFNFSAGISILFFILWHIFYLFIYAVLHLLLLLATNNFILPTLSFSTFLHVLLLVHYDATRLSPLLAFCPLVHTLYSFLALVLPLSVIPPLTISLLLFLLEVFLFFF